MKQSWLGTGGCIGCAWLGRRVRHDLGLILRVKTLTGVKFETGSVGVCVRAAPRRTVQCGASLFSVQLTRGTPPFRGHADMMEHSSFHLSNRRGTVSVLLTSFDWS